MPADDVGVMVTARGRRDEARAVDDVRQQQCLAHLQRPLREVLATKTGRAGDFGAGLNARRQDARPLWHADHDGAATDGATAS
jgi:hypothetical protein